MLSRCRRILLSVALLCLLAPVAAAQNPLTGADAQTQAESIDLASPRATLQSFLTLTDDAAPGETEKWARAAQCLTIPGELANRGTERAKLLREILIKLDAQPEELLSRQIVEQAEKTRFTFFPQAQYHAWIGPHLAEGVTLETLHPIVLTRGTGGEWRFAESTVRQLPALRQHLEPVPAKGDISGFNRVLNWLGPTFERTSGWGWLALLGAILVGLVAGRVAKTVLNRLAHRFGQKTWGVRSTVLHDAAAPASLLLLTIGLTIGLQFIHREGTVESVTRGTLQLLYILALGWFVYNLVDTVDLALRRVTQSRNHKINESVIPLVRRTLRVFVVIVLLLLVTQNVFGMSITGLIAGLGVAGLAISLAAQESVKNVFGSLTVFFDKVFSVGDFITFGSYTGIVEEIGFRSTRLRLLSGHLVTIPNMKFIDGDIENIGARPYIRRVMDITITYDTPPAKIDEAVEIVRDILTNDETVVREGQFDMTNFPPRIAFDGLNADSLNIKAYYWYQLNKDPNRGYWTYLDHCQTVNDRVVKRFEDAGIEFAFPTQTLYLAGDEKRRLTVHQASEDGQDGQPSAAQH
jgi:MscS family membrane protein